MFIGKGAALAAAMLVAISPLAGAIAQPMGNAWRVVRADNGNPYAMIRTGMPALPELRLACGPGGSPVLAAVIPGHPAGAHLYLGLTTASGEVAVLDTQWQRAPEGANWLNVLRDPTVPNLLGGQASHASVRLNARSLGRLSLAGSTHALREALAGCWQPAAARSGAAIADAGFGIDIVLSPRAAAELARRGEGIVVATYFSGSARNEQANHVDDHTGELDLGSHEVTVAGRNGHVAIPGSALRRERFGNLRGAPQVLVNVFSARRTDENNLISCGIVSGELSQVAGRDHRISCTLISEG